MEEENQATLTLYGTHKRDTEWAGETMRLLGLDVEPTGSNSFLAKLRRATQAVPENPGYNHAMYAHYGVSASWRCALASLMLLGDPIRAREWLVRMAWMSRDAQLRSGGEPSKDALAAVGCTAVSGDWGTIRQYCARHLTSPEGIPGQEGPGGKTPHAQDHYWHFMNFVANWYANGEAAGREALELLLAQKPRKQWRYSSDWWLAMCKLSKASADGQAEDVRRCLAELAPINLKMWGNPNDLIFEGGLALMALGVASMAVRRGLDLRPAPHPSCPTELFYGEPVILGDWAWSSMPDPDPVLADAIRRAAEGDIPHWKKPGKPKRAAKPKQPQ
jgi:hypothetical protein